VTNFKVTTEATTENLKGIKSSLLYREWSAIGFRQKNDFIAVQQHFGCMVLLCVKKII
jgi:hypothetical protein